MSNNSGDTKKEELPPRILTPFPATVSIARVPVEKHVIKDIARRHLALALMEVLGITLERAAERGEPPENALKAARFIERFGNIAERALDTALEFLFGLGPQLVAPQVGASQLGQVLAASLQASLAYMAEESPYANELLRAFIASNIKAIKQQAEKKPDVVKSALKEVREELKQLLALAEH